MKTVYVGLVSDIIVALYITLIFFLNGILKLDTTWLRYLYLLFTIALIVVVIKNHRAIKRNEDEMVKALMGKIDSKLLRSWEFFIMVIALVFALIPAIRGRNGVGVFFDLHLPLAAHCVCRAPADVLVP